MRRDPEDCDGVGKTVGGVLYPQPGRPGSRQRSNRERETRRSHHEDPEHHEQVNRERQLAVRSPVQTTVARNAVEQAIGGQRDRREPADQRPVCAPAIPRSAKRPATPPCFIRSGRGMRRHPVPTDHADRVVPESVCGRDPKRRAVNIRRRSDHGARRSSDSRLVPGRNRALRDAGGQTASSPSAPRGSQRVGLSASGYSCRTAIRPDRRRLPLSCCERPAPD